MDERRGTILIIASIAIVLALVMAWILTPAQDQASAAPLTEVTGTAEIQGRVQLSRLGIATSENFAQQKIRIISGNLKNVSDKPIRMAEIKLVFTDFDGKSVYEYMDRILDRAQRPLAAGEEFRFEVRLENLPRTWNYRIPITEVVKIGY